MSSSLLRPWHREGDRLLLHTPIFDVRGIRFRHPARTEAKEFVVLDTTDWVVVLALTPENQVVMVRQFRFGADVVSLELPGGIIDPGETAVEAAVRELAEETGYVGTNARLLGSFHPNPAIQQNQNHVVLVEQAHPRAELEWDADEELETLLLPAPEAVTAAADGRVTHALMVNALFLLDRHLRTNG